MTPPPRARASRRGLSVNVSVPRRRPGRFLCQRVYLFTAAAGGAVCSWNCPGAPGVLHRALLQMTRLPLLAEKERKTDAA